MKITKEQAVEMGMFTKEEAKKGIRYLHRGGWVEWPIGEIHVSEELIQDKHLLDKNLYANKTDPITLGEIEEWKEADKRLNAVDIEEAKKRVTIITKLEPPYQDYRVNWNNYKTNKSATKPRWKRREEAEED